MPNQMTKAELIHRVSANVADAMRGFSQTRIEAILELGATKQDCIDMYNNVVRGSSIESEIA